MDTPKTPIKTFDMALREAFEAGFDSHVYDPSDRRIDARFAKWRRQFGDVPTTDDDYYSGPAVVR